jgi:predicted ATPase
MEFFQVFQRTEALPVGGKSSAYLRTDSWNDFSFQTLFQLHCFDEEGRLHELGDVKIGFRGQTISTPTYTQLSRSFTSLGGDFFSLGQGVEFYKKLSALSGSIRAALVDGLQDIVAHPEIINTFKDEHSLSTSLLRGVTLATVKGQYRRVLAGKSELTNFNFGFSRPETEEIGAIELGFKVVAESTPSTNIHAIIGRNGVGKTTLLNGMIDAITLPASPSAFFAKSRFSVAPITTEYFSSLVSVSFSAFDPFNPPHDQPDPTRGTCYFYVGLKDANDPHRLRSLGELQADCASSLISCFSRDDRKTQWESVIRELGSDENFASMRLERLHKIYMDLLPSAELAEVQTDSEEFRELYLDKCRPFLDRMSSGHAVVFFIMTRLVSLVEEKTLVLLDEPESHLHPPLLAAFIRALTDLLHDRNGIAIVATHSPVVLQEVPKSCVWKVYRTGKSVDAERPRIETFGENVGTLTSDVFRLEVSRSGFHKLLAESVAHGMTYDQIIQGYDGQLGLEGRAILRLLISTAEGAKS